MITLIVVGLVLSLLVSFVAAARGRSGVAWFVLSLLFTPIVSGPVLLLLRPART